MLNDVTCDDIKTRPSVGLPIVHQMMLFLKSFIPSTSQSTVIPEHTPHSYPHLISTAMHPHAHSNTHAHTTQQSVEDLRRLYEELGERLR